MIEDTSTLIKVSASKAREQRLYDALHHIAHDYETTEGLRAGCGNEYGLEYQEALEMAYENLQVVARNAILRMRRPK